MQRQTFYIPIKSESLPHYLGRGIILPSNFYKNKPIDIQNRVTNAILLMTDRWISEVDCSVEIILAEQEILTLFKVEDQEGIYFYQNAIPISRIAAVHFLEIKQSEITQWNINNGAGYLPDRLIHIESNARRIKNLGDLAGTITLLDDLKGKAKRFDVFMGGLSFLNVAKKKSMLFAKDYFAVVGYFNILIREEYKKAVDAGLATYNDRLTTFFKKENPWREIQQLMLEDVDLSVVESLAKESNVRINQKYGLIDLDGLKRHHNLYLLALMATYGENKPKGILDLINDVIIKNLNEEASEEIAFIFGMHIRYSQLRNSYHAFSNVVTKFKMETKLDYYIIESVYELTFNNNKVTVPLDYIEAIAPTSRERVDLSNNGFQILDVFVPVERTYNNDGLIKNGVQLVRGTVNDKLMPYIEGVMVDIVKELEKKHQVNVESLIKENTQLKRILDLHASRTEELPIIEKPVEEALATDGLEDMDIKELKALAKSLKAPPKIVNSFKSSKSDIEKLIQLIREFKQQNKLL